MAERGAIDFEPLVEFPEDPTAAARLYLAVMAYPELGAGQINARGAEFARVLASYALWYHRRCYGLRSLRKIMNDPLYCAPTIREIKGPLERGRRRLRRRFAAFDIVGNQLINAMLNSNIQANRIARRGSVSDAFEISADQKFSRIRPEIFQDAMPSVREVIRSNPTRWSERFGLNKTGNPSDYSQKERDLISRGYMQSRPVLHMAHGLNQIIADSEKLCSEPSSVDWLLLLIWRAEEWVWQALDYAISWRSASAWDRMTVQPNQLIELRYAKKSV